jgi:two-component system response regulator RegA
MSDVQPEDTAPNPRLLIVDDDAPFRDRLARAMEKRGFDVATAADEEAANHAIGEHQPTHAILDLRLENSFGLDIVPTIRAQNPDARIIILTGYGNIATAVAAVKAGAVDYLAKPADADEIEDALRAAGGDKPPPPAQPMTPDRVRWEHIQRVYELCDRNVSETARRLNMHRRTLQRILAKRSPH